MWLTAACRRRRRRSGPRRRPACGLFGRPLVQRHRWCPAPDAVSLASKWGPMTLKWDTPSEPWLMGSGTLQAGLTSALRAAELMGIEVPPSGRHQRALKLLARYNRNEIVVALTDPTTLAPLEAAHQTAWYAVLILCAASLYRRHRYTPFSRDKLTLMMGGADLHDGRSALARNTEFELYLASLFALASAEVRVGEPDVRLRYGYELVGLAAKRIRSTARRQLSKHIDDAVDQIGRSRLRGLIAIKLESRFSYIDPRQQEDVVLKGFSDAFDSINPHMAKHETNPRLLGYMAFGYISHWRPPTKLGGPPELHFTTPFRWQGWALDPAEHLLHRDFTTGWRDRIHTRLANISRGVFECR